jgi:hypothetical protein
LTLYTSVELNIFKDILKNPLFPIIISSVAVVQALFIQFAGSVMGTVPLGYQDWLVCIACGLGSLPFGVIVRLLPFDR